MGFGSYEVIWDSGFERSLIRLGLTWRQWEELGGRKGIEKFLGANPYEEEGTSEMPGTDGARFAPTKDKAPDLPELLVAYRVDPLKREVCVLGANPFWGEDALQRP
jgi:hypothetical protein